jgi:hypothetical protein
MEPRICFLLRVGGAAACDDARGAGVAQADPETISRSAKDRAVALRFIAVSFPNPYSDTWGRIQEEALNYTWGDHFNAFGLGASRVV